MSRYRNVLLETDRVLNKDNVDYGSRIMTNLFLKQISDTLAMIYDDGFAKEIAIKEEHEETKTEGGEAVTIEASVAKKMLRERLLRFNR